jgi:copper chaperone CopZ
MKDHTVTVSFDSEEASVAQVIEALNGAGYYVPDYRQLN